METTNQRKEVKLIPKEKNYRNNESKERTLTPVPMSRKIL
jgi:hypothetical protein